MRRQLFENVTGPSEKLDVRESQHGEPGRAKIAIPLRISFTGICTLVPWAIYFDDQPKFLPEEIDLVGSYRNTSIIGQLIPRIFQHMNKPILQPASRASTPSFERICSLANDCCPPRIAQPDQFHAEILSIKLTPERSLFHDVVQLVPSEIGGKVNEHSRGSDEWNPILGNSIARDIPFPGVSRIHAFNFSPLFSDNLYVGGLRTLPPTSKYRSRQMCDRGGMTSGKRSGHTSLFKSAVLVANHIHCAVHLMKSTTRELSSYCAGGHSNRQKLLSGDTPMLA
jgi:hypothetical protein